MTKQTTKQVKQRLVCHADRDGECTWKQCPQNRDSEPKKSGRSCPLHWPEDDEV